MGDISVTKIQRINELYLELAERVCNSTVKAIELGEELLDARKTLDHGKLRPWIEDNFPFSYRTAVRYMNAALNKKDILKQLKGKKALLLTDASSVGIPKVKTPGLGGARPAGPAKRGTPKALSAAAQALWDQPPSVPLDRYRICARGGAVLMKTPEMRSPVMVCTVTADPIPGCEDAYEQLNSGLQLLFEQYYALIEAHERGSRPEQPRRRGRLRNVTESAIDDYEEEDR